MCLGMAGAGLSMIVRASPTRSCRLPSCSSSAASSSAASTPPSTPCSPTTRRRLIRGAFSACCSPRSRSARWQAPARRPHRDIPRHPLGLRLLRRPAALPELRHLAPLPRPARLLNQSAKAICLQSSGRILPPSCRTNKVFKPLYPGTQRMWPYEHTHCR